MRTGATFLSGSLFSFLNVNMSGFFHCGLQRPFAEPFADRLRQAHTHGAAIVLNARNFLGLTFIDNGFAFNTQLFSQLVYFGRAFGRALGRAQ